VRVSLDVTAIPVAAAGAGRYVLELAAALSVRDDVDLALVSRRGDGDRWRSVTGEGSPVAAVAPSARPLRLVWEQLRMPSAIRRSGAEVHHGPHYTMPERSSVPTVVTVHDCTFFDHPEWHQRSKVVLFRRAIRVAAERAAVVVCVSDATARHLASLFSVAGPIVVAPHGVDHERFSPEAPPGPGDDALLRAAGVDPGRPFVLFVGTVEPRKDVASLVQAFAHVADEDAGVQLVIAGRRGWKEDAVDRALAGAARHRSRIVSTGYVPDPAVPALRRAAVVAYPSLAEGYGLPALEALACGAPLVTTTGTAMAELAGDAAVLVPPKDPESLAGALAGVLAGGPGDPAAAERRRRGLEVASGRTWSASAAQHVTAYRMAAGPPVGA
jgi:glycosyltransferase involved in cell wall biosynthesis